MVQASLSSTYKRILKKHKSFQHMRRGFLNTSKDLSGLRPPVNNITTTFTLSFKPTLCDQTEIQSLERHLMFLTYIPAAHKNLRADPFGATVCVVSRYTSAFLQHFYRLPTELPPITKPSYQITPCKDATKGLGMFATRPINKGDLIISERPILVVTANRTAVLDMQDFSLPSDVLFQTTNERWEQVLTKALNTLPAEKEREYTQLYDTHVGETGMGSLVGILRTNALHVSSLNDKALEKEIGMQGASWAYHIGVCKDISRINHSCDANGTYSFNMKAFVFEVAAVKDIKEGEEISVPYCPAELLKEERIERLRPYGIHCKCQLCV